LQPLRSLLVFRVAVFLGKMMRDAFVAIDAGLAFKFGRHTIFGLM
jgi:hypothetical protein